MPCHYEAYKFVVDAALVVIRLSLFLLGGFLFAEKDRVDCVSGGGVGVGRDEGYGFVDLVADEGFLGGDGSAHGGEFGVDC